MARSAQRLILLMSTNVIIAPRMQPLVLNFGPFVKRMNDEEFAEFCQLNRDLRIERTGEGDLIIMSPTGGETGRRNFNLTVLFGEWVEREGTGIGFDSSTGFTLPNGAKRSPDLGWIRRTRWEQLSAAEKEGFPPLCPDFVAELRSRSDDLEALQEKLREYVANGAQLGWLIDPEEKKVYVYRPNAQMECLEDPKTLSGEPILRGFVLDLERIW